MKISEMFPDGYVKGEDLKGKHVTVTIVGVRRVVMRPNRHSPEITKYVLYSAEGTKGIVLSKTLAKQIARALGSEETEHWIGKRITLYPKPMVVAGVPRVAIRVRQGANSK